jgi:WD40 repeat protein
VCLCAPASTSTVSLAPRADRQTDGRTDGGDPCSSHETLIPKLYVWAQVPDDANTSTPFTQIRFSANGRLLLAVAGGRVNLLDAYQGALLARFPTASADTLPEAAPVLEASFSPDGRYLASGTLMDRPGGRSGRIDRPARQRLRRDVWSWAYRRVRRFQLARLFPAA